MTPVAVVAGLIVFWLLLSVKVLNEYERGVIFRLGKVLPKPKGPGLIIVAWPIDRMARVSLRTVVLDVPPQDVITRDNVTVKVSQLSAEPVSLHLRYLQTLVEIAAEKNSAVIFPVPIDWLKALMGARRE
jgi:regulator of protease activity HflC (stomatin/prohibitin superfamily)